MSDTNTKTLLNKLSGKVSRLPTLPSYANKRVKKHGQAKRQYHPARMIMTVLGINLIPLTVLLFCVALVGDYRESLINMELELLHTQSKLYAKTIETLDDTQKLDHEYLVKTLNIQPTHQLVLFNNKKETVFQTDYIAVNNTNTNASVIQKVAKDVISSLMHLTKVDYNAPIFPPVDTNAPESFPGISDSLRGINNIAAWTTNKEELILSSAIPVFKHNELYGALFILHSGENLTQSIANIQEDIFRIFISILTLSIAFSLYLVGTITNPLRRLANAVEDIRSGSSLGAKEIPDMSNRGDEIGELSRALSAMVEALWERMGAIEAFAADVSHELKNPITSIKSALETLPKVKNKTDKDQLIKILEYDTDRLDRLITDISKSTRLDTELSKGNTENIHIVEFVKEMKRIYEQRSEQQYKNLDIKILNLTENNIFIYGYKEKLVQVFTNIIDNAISLSKGSPEITLVIKEDKQTVTISINDNGPGIPPTKLNKIFERFYSDRPKREGLQHHSGLGLSIVQQIILAHDGEITAENLTNKKGDAIGASFIIKLPISTWEKKG